MSSKPLKMKDKQRGFILNPTTAVTVAARSILPIWGSHFEGTNGAAAATDDLGGNTITFGGAAALSTTQFKFGAASLNIPTSDATADITVVNSSFAPGTGDFCIRGWMYADNAGATTNGTEYTFLDTRDGSKVGFRIGLGDSYRVLYQGTNPTFLSSLGIGAAFNFIELYRIGGALKLYVGGTLAVSETDSRSLTFNTIRFGGTSAFPGTYYLDDWEFRKGGFTPYAASPPSSAFISTTTTRLAWAGTNDANGMVTLLNSGIDAHIVSNAAGGSGSSAFTGTDLTGKKYVEIKVNLKVANAAFIGVGVAPTINNVFYTNGAGTMFSGSGGCGVPTSGWTNNGAINGSGTYQYAQGDVLGIAFDATTRNLWFSKNGVWLSGDPSAGTTPTMTLGGVGVNRFHCSIYTCSSGGTYELEIRSRAIDMLYAIPTGFSAYST